MQKSNLFVPLKTMLFFALTFSLAGVALTNTEAFAACNGRGYNQMCGSLIKNSNGSITIKNPAVYVSGKTRKIYAGKVSEGDALWARASGICRRAGYKYVTSLGYEEDGWLASDRVVLDAKGEILGLHPTDIAAMCEYHCVWATRHFTSVTCAY